MRNFIQKKIILLLLLTFVFQSLSFKKNEKIYSYYYGYDKLGGVTFTFANTNALKSVTKYLKLNCGLEPVPQGIALKSCKNYGWQIGTCHTSPTGSQSFDLYVASTTNSCSDLPNNYNSLGKCAFDTLSKHACDWDIWSDKKMIPFFIICGFLTLVTLWFVVLGTLRAIDYCCYNCRCCSRYLEKWKKLRKRQHSDNVDTKDVDIENKNYEYYPTNQNLN